jgi:hypothetical protein
MAVSDTNTVSGILWPLYLLPESYQQLKKELAVNYGCKKYRSMVSNIFL